MYNNNEPAWTLFHPPSEVFRELGGVTGSNGNDWFLSWFRSNNIYQGTVLFTIYAFRFWQFSIIWNIWQRRSGNSISLEKWFSFHVFVYFIDRGEQFGVNLLAGGGRKFIVGFHFWVFKSCKISHHIYMNSISIVISIIRKIVYIVKALDKKNN